MHIIKLYQFYCELFHDFIYKQHSEKGIKGKEGLSFLKWMKE